MAEAPDITDDARQGLERLVVGRECNGFDKLSPERKALAYAQLVRAGLVYGSVQEVEGRGWPDVEISRVSSRGRRLVRVKSDPARSGLLPGLGTTLLYLLFFLAAGLAFLAWLSTQ
ncbi:MAG: hypothetical protein ACO3ND_09850 [Opitutales bacterium]